MSVSFGGHYEDEGGKLTFIDGRCEDYPCCGHAPGECAPQESFTKEYWQRKFDEMGPELLYEYDTYGWPGEEH